MQRYIVVATQGVSPGIVPELVSNLASGRVEGLPRDGRVEVSKVVILATSNPAVVTAAETAVAILRCCEGFGVDVELRVAKVEDVVDRVSFDAFRELVADVLRELLPLVGRRVEGERVVETRVLFDVTGGRVGMALAAFIELYRAFGRGLLLVSNTQVAPEFYQKAQSAYNEIRGRLVELLRSRDVCRALREAGLLERLCGLVSGEARTSILWEA